MLWILITLMVTASEISAYHRTEDYDQNVGIPMAIKIKQYEDKIMAGANNSLDNRISRGWRADHLHYPFLAGLLMQVGEDILSYCCGTLITLTRVGTAAHCVYRNKYDHYIRVVLGSDFLYYGGIRTDTSQYVVHPKWIYEPNGKYVDAAIVKLETAVTFTPTIKPVTLPSEYLDQSFTGYAAFIAGYGVVEDPVYTISTDPVYPESDTNEALEVKVISNEECKLDDKAAICTSGEGGIGVCMGDSGAPLIVKICSDNYVWIGIVRGIEVKQCELSYPSQYTRITEIMDFVNDNLQYEK